jgi:hypothetical protein
MIIYPFFVLVLLFIGAVRLVNWVRFRHRRFSIAELLVAMALTAAALGLWNFAQHVGR